MRVGKNGERVTFTVNRSELDKIECLIGKPVSVAYSRGVFTFKKAMTKTKFG